MREWIPDSRNADGSVSGVSEPPLGFIDGSESFYTTMHIRGDRYFMDHEWWNELSLKRKLWELCNDAYGDEGSDGYIIDSKHRDVCNIISGGC